MELKQLLKHMSNAFTDSPKHARRRPSKPIDNTLATIDHLEERVLLAADYGDAPDSSNAIGKNDYQTTAPNNGPRHTIDATKTTLFLGASVDGDLGLSQSRAAVLDDLFSAGGKNDADGVLNALDLTSTVGAKAKVTLSATNKTSKAATLSGWIDFNQNRIFENATERASIAVPKGTIAGRFTLTFPTTPTGSLGATYARFRPSTDAAATNSTGSATDGEVEDFPFEVKPRVNFRNPHLTYSVMNDSPAVAPTSFFLATTAPVGDLDGNGVIDMSVGAPGENEQAGAIYVIFRNGDGSAKSSIRIASQLNGGPTLTPNEYFGASMEPLGDIDGDGIADLAIGSLGTNDKGAVYICRLNSDGTIKAFTKLASGIYGFPVVPNDARAGVIAPIGDIDNDGIRDIAIGAPGIDAGGSDRGAIYIVRLKADGKIKSYTTIANTASWNLEVADDNQFGSRIASPGDLDRDGTQELAVLSEATTEYGSSISIMHVLSLKNDSTLLKAKRSIEELRTHPGIPFDIFGTNPAGDVNGDGINDLVISGIIGCFGISDQISIATLNSDGSIGSVLQIPSNSLPYDATYLSGVSVLQDAAGGGDLQLIPGMPFQWSLDSPAPGVAVVTIGSAPANTQPPETLKNPAPTGNTNSFTFDLRWDDNPSVHEYLVWLRNDTTGEVLLNSERVPENFLRYNPGFAMGSYSFSVRAKNELGLSPWSPTVRFTVNASPVIKPTPDGMNRRPRIEWTELPVHSYVRSYEMVLTNADSGAAVVRQAGVTGSAWIPATDLPDGQYKVWIRGITPHGLTIFWSAADDFTIRTTTRIGNITRTFLTEPYIDVTEVPGVQYYEASIHNLYNPSTPPVRQNLNVLRTHQGIARLTTSALPSATYRIWVRALGKDGSIGAW
jgi:hypothetical protein